MLILTLSPKNKIKMRKKIVSPLFSILIEAIRKLVIY